VALVSLIERRINDNWLAHEFPEQCPDGNGIAGTDVQSLDDTLRAIIPGLAIPLNRHEIPELLDILDLIDFIGQHISKSIPYKWHDYFSHHELGFDDGEGRRLFREDVDHLFARAGIAFTINNYMQVERLGPPEARQVIADLSPDSGDSTLDNLIIDARTRFLSPLIDDRRLALEKLWDAFERLKTIDPGVDKKQSAGALLGRVASGEWFQRLNDEMRELTTIGNVMQIRHFETSKKDVPEGAVDYLFNRLASMILYLLRSTGRLA